MQAQKCNGCQGDEDDEGTESIKQGWSNDDRLLVPPCVGLVKVSNTLQFRVDCFVSKTAKEREYKPPLSLHSFGRQ